MNIIVKVNEFEDVFFLNNASGYILSARNFSCRYKHSFTLTEIKKIKNYANKNNKQVYILVNRIFKDSEIGKLRSFIIKTNDLGIDGYFFTDFAVFMILKELNVSNKAIFYHETFLRNSYDINTYQQLGINKIICSKDMHIDDIKHLNNNKKDDLGIIVFGYYPLYESIRKVLSNHVNQHNLDKNLVNSFDLSIKEKTRNELYKIIQQDGISSIFADKVICNIEYTDILKEYLDMFIIDSLFFDKEYIYKIIDLFIKSNTQKVNIQEIINLDNSISFTNAFLLQRVGLTK